MRIRIGAVCALAFTLALAGSAFAAASYEEQIVEMVNIERWNNGQLPPLKHNAMLDASSEMHSVNMADRNFFAHCDLDESTLPWDRMTSVGYSWAWAGENIAAGQSTPASVMSGWMNSSGHRANILNTNFYEIGVGYYAPGSDGSNVRLDLNSDCVQEQTNGPFYRYWTQNFGRRYNVYPLVIEREKYGVTTLNVNLYIYGSGWAQQMRLRNGGGAWTEWQPYASNVAWALAPGNGTRTVEVELKNGSTVYTSSDDILVSGQTTGVGDINTFVAGVNLRAPFSNPFKSGTTLSFQVEEATEVQLAVFDIQGRRVALLAEGWHDAGDHAVRWDGRMDSGEQARAGMYGGRMVANGEQRTTKLVLRP